MLDLLLQALNEDYFAIFDLQQASLPGVRTLPCPFKPHDCR
jgi:hypothetical protein